MKRQTFTLLLLSCFYLFAFSQKNPKIEKAEILKNAENIKKSAKDFSMAEKYYRKGIYDEAYKYYSQLYVYAPNLSALNYKTAICCLYGTRPKMALKYMEEAYDYVAKDYYYQLGKAYQYNMNYDSAKVSFSRYQGGLKWYNRKGFNKQIKQLNSECDFGSTALADTLPIFIINLGPVINSWFDDYNAVISTPAENQLGDTTVFFTSRRPKFESDKIVNRYRYKERIFATVNCINRPAEDVSEPQALIQSTNSSIAGISPADNHLFFYQGKWRNGNIYTAEYSGNVVKKVRQLKGSINKIASKESSITIDNNGNAYFVSNRMGTKGGNDIWSAKKTGKYRYRKVRNLGSVINTAFNEQAVCVTPDGQTLYFSSNGHPGMGGFDVFRVQKQDNGTWGEPINMGYPINSPANELFYRPTTDSMVAIYSTLRDGSKGGLDIYKIQKDPRIPFELYGQVTDSATGKILPATISVFNNLTSELVASTNQDTISGQYILTFEDKGDFNIQIDAPEYHSKKDVVAIPTKRFDKITQSYQLERMKHPFTLWGIVTNAKNNTPILADVVFKDLKQDSIVLFRTATNPQTGAYSISFEDKMNLKMEVSGIDYFGYSEPLLLKSSSLSKEEKNIGLLPSKINYTLTGNITDIEAKTPVKGKVKLYKAGVAEPVVVTPSDSVTGKYVAVLNDVGPFLIEITADGFFFLNSTAQFPVDSTLLLKNFELQKMNAGVKIVIENILFNTGKSTLKPLSYVELGKLVNLLLENKKVRIEVSGHTDNVGAASSNKTLSKARALSVRNYLINNGVSADRLEYQGYGFDEPIAPNNTDAGRSQNRRVEIKVLE